MIDQGIKRCVGQMIKGVQVVGARHDGVDRLYCSHWVSQVSFEHPIPMASVSPRHDTHPLIVASKRFSVSILAGDQVAAGQYFSYPGRRFRHMAGELVEEWEGMPVVPDSIAWLACEVFDTKQLPDHELFFARIVAVREGRLRQPPLLYSARLGWRVTGPKAREEGVSIRDQLLARLRELGQDVDEADDGDTDDGEV